MKNLRFIILVLFISCNPNKSDTKKTLLKNGGISVEVIGLVDSNEVIQNTNYGLIKTKLYTFIPKKEDNDPNSSYSISYDIINDSINLKDSLKVEQLFNEVIESCAKNLNGHIISNIKLNNKLLSREVKIEFLNKQFFLTGRYYFKNNIVYVTQVLTPEQNLFNKKVNIFLNSFQLLK